jgi:hypothetical protein
MKQTIEHKILSRIYGNGMGGPSPGWILRSGRSIKVNLPNYASVIVATDEIIGKLAFLDGMEVTSRS